jgi:hypothetical protein
VEGLAKDDPQWMSKMEQRIRTTMIANQVNDPKTYNDLTTAQFILSVATPEIDTGGASGVVVARTIPDSPLASKCDFSSFTIYAMPYFFVYSDEDLGNFAGKVVIPSLGVEVPGPQKEHERWHTDGLPPSFRKSLAANGINSNPNPHPGYHFGSTQQGYVHYRPGVKTYLTNDVDANTSDIEIVTKVFTDLVNTHVSPVVIKKYGHWHGEKKKGDPRTQYRE